jgi:hypothetical protein
MFSPDTAQITTCDPAQDFSTIGTRLVQLDSLLDAIRVVASPMVAEDCLDEGQIEDLVDIAKHLLRQADSAFCRYRERASLETDAATQHPVL